MNSTGSNPRTVDRAGKMRLLAPLVLLTVSMVGLTVAWISRNTPPPNNSQPANSEQDDSHSPAGRIAEPGLQPPSNPVLAAALQALDDPNCPDSVLLQRGQEAFSAGQIGTAEKCYRRALNSNPAATANRLWLGRLLFCTGRVFEARRMWEPLLQTGGIDLLTLPMLGNAELNYQSETQAIRRGLEGNPDVTTRLANAHLDLTERNTDTAAQILAPLLETIPPGQWPDQLKILWAQYLSVTGRNQELQAWFANDRSQLASPHPDYLCQQGQLCLALGLIPQATRCFAEAFELAPNHYVASSQLAELLQIDNNTEAADFYRQRSLLIKEYETICRRVHVNEALPPRTELEALIAVCHSLKAYREVMAWCTVAQAIHQPEQWMVPLARQCEADISPGDARFSDISTLNKWLSTASYPTPDWKSTDRIAATQTDSESTIRFEDQAAAVGIDFVYENGSDPSTDTRFFEFVGGGVAVIDLDGDTWPDLFFTQGGDSPQLGRPDHAPPPANAQSADQLYRNHTGSHFSNVTSAAGLVDSGYSQGCTVGDINQDGFPDLYVANIGSNQLLLNNGDGTFTPTATGGEPRWTTSCAIGDITGDSIPDIYDVNHIVAAGVHEKMCYSKDSTFPCDLEKMQPEQDCLLQGDGSGAFLDITTTCGIVQPDGIGLGIVVADLNNSGRLSVFVANDARPNFLFVRSDDRVLFSNEADSRGLALNVNGRMQACMGVAAGDADSDGLLDLFVTNFYADHNTYYRQHIPSFFMDSTAQANLLVPSFDLLGFGTQFLDADLDGDLDLVLTNGDIADFSSSNPDRPWQQRSQFFSNTNGVFQELTAAQVGSYFERPVLGRGLATLDWNQDGLPDVVVSHIGSPAALLTNQTRKNEPGHQATVRLIGTRSARSPVGASVTVHTADRTLVRQLMAGCGYQSHNESVLRFGLNTSPDVNRMTVFWPTGTSDSIDRIPAGGNLVILETGQIFFVPN